MSKHFIFLLILWLYTVYCIHDIADKIEVIKEYYGNNPSSIRNLERKLRGKGLNFKWKTLKKIIDTFDETGKFYIIFEILKYF